MGNTSSQKRGAHQRDYTEDVVEESAPHDVLCELGGRQVHYLGDEAAGQRRKQALELAVQRQRQRVAALRCGAKPRSHEERASHAWLPGTATSPPDTRSGCSDIEACPAALPGAAPPLRPSALPEHGFIALPHLDGYDNTADATREPGGILLVSNSIDAVRIASSAPASAATAARHDAGALEAAVYEQAGMRPLRHRAAAPAAPPDSDSTLAGVQACINSHLQGAGLPVEGGDASDSDEAEGTLPCTAAVALFPNRRPALRATAAAAHALAVVAAVEAHRAALQAPHPANPPPRGEAAAAAAGAALCAAAAAACPAARFTSPAVVSAVAPLSGGMAPLLPKPSPALSSLASLDAPPLPGVQTPHELRMAQLRVVREEERLLLLNTERDEDHEREVLHLEEMNAFGAFTSAFESDAPREGDAEGPCTDSLLQAAEDSLTKRAGAGNSSAQPPLVPSEGITPAERETKQKRKKKLVSKLNNWKQAYQEKHGKMPTKRHIARDPDISAVFEEYIALEKQLGSSKSKKKSASKQRAEKELGSTDGGAGVDPENAPRGEEEEEEREEEGVLPLEERHIDEGSETHVVAPAQLANWGDASRRYNTQEEDESVESPAAMPGRRSWGATHTTTTTAAATTHTTGASDRKSNSEEMLRDVSDDFDAHDGACSTPPAVEPRPDPPQPQPSDTTAPPAGDRRPTPPVSQAKLAFGDAPTDAPQEEQVAETQALPEADPPQSQGDVAEGGGGGSVGSPEGAAPAPAPRGGRKAELTAQLNAWKAEFTEARGKAPTKADIRKDPVILPVFEEYEALGKAGKKAKKDKPVDEAKAQRKAVNERKKVLVKELNAWKAQYEAEHGVAPTKKNMKTAPDIKALYEEYTQLSNAPNTQKLDNTEQEGVP